MSGSGVGALGCEHARDPSIDGPSDSRLPAAAVRPTKRLAALMNKRRSSVEDWRIASLITRVATGRRYSISMGLNYTLPSTAEPDLAEADWAVAHVIACHSFFAGPHRDKPWRMAKCGQWNFWLWHKCEVPAASNNVRSQGVHRKTFAQAEFF
jgi:hypothetical protein